MPSVFAVRIAFVLSAALTSPILIGCGQGDGRLDVRPTTGVVLRDGLPVPGATVVLNPAPGTPAAAAGLLPSAETDADGTFVVSSYESGDGAPAGEYSVTLGWPDRSYKPRTPAEREAALAGDVPDRLGGRYRDPAKSTWTVVVTEGAENRLPPIELPGDRRTASR